MDIMHNKRAACLPRNDGWISEYHICIKRICVYVKPVQIVRYIGNESSNMVATFLDQQFEHWIF